MLNKELELALIRSQPLLSLRGVAQGFQPKHNAPIRQNLIVVRAGDASLHREWLSDPSRRNFDIFISYEGGEPDLYQKDADYYESAPGLKWMNLSRLFAKKRELLFSYDACWFPDDDLSVDTQTISKMFDLFHAYQLWLAQPAFLSGSVISHPVTALILNSRMRFTDFVEIVCPIFNRVSLAALGPTFAESQSGYGLDFLWPYLLGYPKDRIGILDSTPVSREASARSKSFHAQCHSMGINPGAEASRINAKYGLTAELRTEACSIIPSD